MFTHQRQALVELALFIYRRLPAGPTRNARTLLEMIYQAEIRHLCKYLTRLTEDDYLAFPWGHVPKALYQAVLALRNGAGATDPEDLPALLAEAFRVRRPAQKGCIASLEPLRECNDEYLSQSDKEAALACVGRYIDTRDEYLSGVTDEPMRRSQALGAPVRVPVDEMARIGGANDAEAEYIETQEEVRRFARASFGPSAEPQEEQPTEESAEEPVGQTTELSAENPTETPQETATSEPAVQDPQPPGKCLGRPKKTGS